jgi:hypothetical protein
MDEGRDWNKTDKRQWCDWLTRYLAAEGREGLFDALVRTIQGAQSTCTYCEQFITCDIVEGGGVPDWKTSDGDYGCDDSPETSGDGCGSHKPIGVA